MSVENQEFGQLPSVPKTQEEAEARLSDFQEWNRAKTPNVEKLPNVEPIPPAQEPQPVENYASGDYPKTDPILRKK